MGSNIQPIKHKPEPSFSRLLKRAYQVWRFLSAVSVVYLVYCGYYMLKISLYVATPGVLPIEEGLSLQEDFRRAMQTVIFNDTPFSLGAAVFVNYAVYRLTCLVGAWRSWRAEYKKLNAPL